MPHPHGASSAAAMSRVRSKPGAPAPLLTRIASGLRYAVTGAHPADWFGPAAPLPAEAPAGVKGRAFDYPVGFNLRVGPRAETGLSFQELRGLAERWDLLRLAIETRKDQIERLRFAIRPRRLRLDAGPAAAADDPRLVWLTRFFQNPDREHGWAGWLRLLLEDLFVIDAPCLYVRRDRAGGLYALEVIDGATIKPVLDAGGRRPLPPDPAYQQILKGVPAVDYTGAELLYWPRNPRPHRVYGFSPVEQIAMTANIALRRQVSQLEYFTSGNSPDALIGVPDAWTAEQIRQFQEYWDALLDGDLSQRRRARFVPGGLKYQPTREPPLKDDFDEWLARIVCFAFSLPPTAFTRGTNRATAETQQEAALTEGLAPLQLWLKALIDRVIVQVLDWPDLEFVWAEDAAPDPAAQAQIDIGLVGAGIKTRNEVRAELGLDPLPQGDIATTATPVTPLGQAPAAGGGTLAKAAGTLTKAGFNPDEPRDERGRWTDDGSTAETVMTDDLRGPGGASAVETTADAEIPSGGGDVAQSDDDWDPDPSKPKITLLGNYVPNESAGPTPIPVQGEGEPDEELDLEPAQLDEKDPEAAAEAGDTPEEIEYNHKLAYAKLELLDPKNFLLTQIRLPGPWRQTDVTDLNREIDRVQARLAGEMSLRNSAWDAKGWAARGDDAEAERILQATGKPRTLHRQFSVIDTFENGVATSIKSIDLGAPTYQNIPKLENKIDGYVDDLVDFDGGRVKDDKIEASEIKGRVLDLVVPRGRIYNDQLGALARSKIRAQELGVELELSQF